MRVTRLQSNVCSSCTKNGHDDVFLRNSVGRVRAAWRARGAARQSFVRAAMWSYDWTRVLNEKSAGSTMRQPLGRGG